MRDNSITLQTIEVTYSGWCDQIITIMLSFTTVFGANIRTSDQLSLAWPKIITFLYLLKQYGMPNIGASDPLKLAWPDNHYCYFLKNYKTKTGASNQSSLMWSDHHYQIIGYKSWSKRWTKNCATRSSLSHYLSWQCCETNKGARDKLRFVWPDNHYPVICYSSIVWPYQHNHDMRDNSITLQTIEVTYSGWCDLIITSMLSFSTVFCDKYRNKWPADLVRSSWSYNLSKEYGKPSIQASH